MLHFFANGDLSATVVQYGDGDLFILKQPTYDEQGTVQSVRTSYFDGSTYYPPNEIDADPSIIKPIEGMPSDSSTIQWNPMELLSMAFGLRFPYSRDGNPNEDFVALMYQTIEAAAEKNVTLDSEPLSQTDIVINAAEHSDESDVDLVLRNYMRPASKVGVFADCNFITNSINSFVEFNKLLQSTQ
jgi:hypothetical protein